MSYDFRYLDRTTIQKVSFLSGLPIVGGPHSWDQENEIRQVLLLSTRFCLAAMRFGRPKKETRKGTRPLLCHIRTSPTKKVKNATILFVFFSASAFCLCLAFFCSFAGERNASGLPLFPFFCLFYFFFARVPSKWGPIFLTLASRHSRPLPPFGSMLGNLLHGTTWLYI